MRFHRRFFAALIITGRPFGYEEWGLGLSILIVNLLTPVIGIFAMKDGIATAKELADSMGKVHPTENSADKCNA